MVYSYGDSVILLFSILNLILIVLFTVLSFSILKQRFSAIKKRTWLLLSLVFLLGFVLRMFLVPHATYNFGDDAQGVSAARSIALYGEYFSCQDYDYRGNCVGKSPIMHPAAHPLILAISFLVFGTGYNIAFNTVAVLGSVSIIMMFIFSFLFFKNERIALLSALLLSLAPIPAIFSGTPDFRVTSVLFILMTFSCFLLYLENKSYRLLLLALSLLAFTTQTMPEMILIIPFVALIFILFDQRFKQRMTDLKFWLCLLVLLLLIAPQMIKTATNLAHNQSWRISSNVASYYYLKMYIGQNLRFWLFGTNHPPFMTLFALVALILPLSIYWKQRLFLGTFFAILFLFYSSYSLGLFGLSVRYTLIPYVSLIVLASLFIHIATRNITKKHFACFAIAGLSILALFVPNLRVTEYLPNGQTPEFEFLHNSRTVINKDCYILTLWPYLMTPVADIPSHSVRNVRNISEISNILRNTSCVLFYKGPECQAESCDTASDIFGKKLCQDCVWLFERIKESHNLSIVATTKIYNSQITFYRIK